jgi:hypothetical protein
MHSCWRTEQGGAWQAVLGSAALCQGCATPVATPSRTSFIPSLSHTHPQLPADGPEVNQAVLAALATPAGTDAAAVAPVKVKAQAQHIDAIAGL